VSTEPIQLYHIASVRPPTLVHERLPFVLPDFNRHSWISESAKSVWEPRISRILHAWLHIEWLSVAAGIRECALIWISPNVLPKVTPMWEAAQLSAVQLDIDDTGLQTNTSGLICVIVGALDNIERLRQAWVSSDHEAVGRQLGYPPCCRTFFSKVWVDQRCIDTTWAMSENTSRAWGKPVVQIEPADDVPPLANILWRWVGVRAVPHLPCRFDCPDSIKFGRRLLELGQEAGYAQEVAWISHILSWPIEWSALHGIAEVKTPILKISTRTDATANKWVVQWVGTAYPEEGAVGLRFPYHVPKRPILTSSPGYQRGLAGCAPGDSTATWRYTDNGFRSETAMQELHQPIIALARHAVAEESGNILDLGCGNGTLLGKLCADRPDLIPYGVDSNDTALVHARQLWPQFAHNFVDGNLFDVELWSGNTRHYRLGLLMLGRLLEVPRERAIRLLISLKLSCSKVLAYTYPDWGDQSLETIAHQFGLELEESGWSTAAYLKKSPPE